MTAEQQELLIDPNTSPDAGSDASTSEAPASQDADAEAGATDTPEQGAPQTDEEKNQAAAEATRRRSEARQRGTERRMAELTRERYNAEARAAAAEQFARMVAAGAQPQQRPQGGMPQREQYGSFEDWQDARTQYITQRTFANMMGAVGQQNAEAEAANQWNARLDRMQTNLSKSLRDYSKANPNFEATIADGHDEQVPWPAAIAVMEHPNAGAMMNHMANNADFVLRLQQMSPDAQRVAVGELAGTLRSGARVSNASRPGEPVGSRPGSSSEPPEDTAKYFEWAKKNMK